VSFIRDISLNQGWGIERGIRAGQSLHKACTQHGVKKDTCNSLARTVYFGDCITTEVRAGNSFERAYYDCAACIHPPGRYPKKDIQVTRSFVAKHGKFPRWHPRGSLYNYDNTDRDTLNEWNTLPNIVLECVASQMKKSGAEIDDALKSCWLPACGLYKRRKLIRRPVNWLLRAVIATSIVMVGMQFVKTE
jgi:hypothetical protein